MKILYLTIVNLDIASSVLTKMNDQIEEWSVYGHEVYVASLPIFNVKQKQVLLTEKAKGFFIFKNYLIKNFFTGGFFNMGSKIMSLKQYKNYINKISPDIIYLRELVAFPGLPSVLNKYKVVLESNALLMDELKANSKILFQLAKLYQDKMNKQIDGFIGVTDEITQQFIKYNKPSVTITNGIKIDNLKTSPPVNSKPQIIMSCSVVCPWHGIDKFIKLAELLPQMDFHLAGPSKAEFPSTLKNLFVHGYLAKTELRNKYANMDIAVGTLALHRKNMQEACALKVREYAALGLPIILAYHDTDFSGNGLEYILQIENTERNIENNISKISEFINRWKGKRIDIENVEPLISIRYKEQKRLEFFQKIIGQKS